MNGTESFWLSVQIMASIIVPIITAAVGWKITRDFNNYQKKQMEQQYKPYLIITNLINNNIKKNRNDFTEIPDLPPISYEKLCDKRLNSHKVLRLNLLKKRGKYGNGTVYHMFYRGYRHLIMNFLENSDDICFDMAPTIIVIKNIGFDLCSYLISKIKVFYKDGATKELNTIEEWQQNYVPSQESFYLLLSMATNKNLYTLCDVSGLKQERIISQNRRMDLLRVDLSNNFLNYNCMEIDIIVRSSFSKEYNYQIVIEVAGDRLCALTKEID